MTSTTDPDTLLAQARRHVDLALACLLEQGIRDERLELLEKAGPGSAAWIACGIGPGSAAWKARGIRDDEYVDFLRVAVIEELDASAAYLVELDMVGAMAALAHVKAAREAFARVLAAAVVAYGPGAPDAPKRARRRRRP
ncbi:MAG TPA: hypothetical protein VK631_29000 [Solirubrobacteraceae bacterium]|nr:hypothetical protein [Solirubrobacteraceae bacterium]